MPSIDLFGRHRVMSRVLTRLTRKKTVSDTVSLSGARTFWTRRHGPPLKGGLSVSVSDRGNGRRRP
jgi:hypothetical protein